MYQTYANKYEEGINNMAKKMKRITEEDAKRVNELLSELGAILEKYDDSDYQYETNFSRMMSGYGTFKEWFGYWTGK